MIKPRPPANLPRLALTVEPAAPWIWKAKGAEAKLKVIRNVVGYVLGTAGVVKACTS